MTRRGSLLGHILRHAVLLAGLVIMLAPFVWMISTSLKPPNEIFSTKLGLLPTNWAAVENYTKAFTTVPLLRRLGIRFGVEEEDDGRGGRAAAGFQ